MFRINTFFLFDGNGFFFLNYIHRSYSAPTQQRTLQTKVIYLRTNKNLAYYINHKNITFS